jgi:hypothetical protein
MWRYRFKDIGGRRRTGDTGRAPARKKGSAVCSTTTSCETAYEPVKQCKSLVGFVHMAGGFKAIQFKLEPKYC